MKNKIPRYITLAERLAENEFTQVDNKDYQQIRINDYVEVRLKQMITITLIRQE